MLGSLLLPSAESPPSRENIRPKEVQAAHFVLFGLRNTRTGTEGQQVMAVVKGHNMMPDKSKPQIRLQSGAQGVTGPWDRGSGRVTGKTSLLNPCERRDL